MKGWFRIAQDASRLRDNRRLLGLQDRDGFTGSSLWCRRLLHRRFLVDDLCNWLCLCLQRCLCPPLALGGRDIWVLGLRLAWLSSLLLWLRCTRIFCFWFWTWLLSGKAARSKTAWSWRCSCRGGCASSNTNTTCRSADGRRRSALLRRVRGRA